MSRFGMVALVAMTMALWTASMVGQEAGKPTADEGAGPSAQGEALKVDAGEEADQSLSDQKPSGLESSDARPAKVRGPYAELDLTAEQRAEIAQIQVETQARIEQLLAEQRQRIMQTLSDQQKRQLEQHQQRAKALSRLHGMRGYLTRLENQRDRLESALAEAQQADDATTIEALRTKLQTTERRLADYRAKVEAQRAKVEGGGDAE